jgi:methionyl-tRNA synthetase
LYAFPEARRSEGRTSYFIGKDNIPFHAIILPSLLRASGKAFNEPYMINSTEFLNFEKQKFSKSRKIGIWIDEALQILPPDYWRYYLISIRPENGDGEFLWSEFAQKINNDLNDAIGNFVNRTLVGVEKFSGGSFTINNESFSREASQECKDQVAKSLDRHSKIKDLYDQARLQSACKASVEQAFEANRFLSATEPWKVVKTDRKKANEILYAALSILKLLSIELFPIIPSSSEEMIRQAGFFKSANRVPSWDRTSLDEDLPINVSEPRPIFSKVSSDKLRERLEEIRAAKKE